MSKIHKIGTAIIITNSEGKFLLQHRDFNPKIKYPGTWVLFGGEKEEGETPEEAIKRELQEELNISVSDYRFFGNFHYEDLEEEHLQYVYHIEMDINVSNITLNEGLGLGYFSFMEIKELHLGFNIKKIINDYQTFTNRTVDQNIG